MDLETEHHPALGVLGDMAVRHPQTGVRDIQQDVDRLAGSHEHCVFPDQIGLRLAVPRENEETARAVNVKWVVHRMIRFHFIDQSDLYPVANIEGPGDRPVFGTSLPIDQLPDHVAGV